jgi:hypothetical protein
MADKILEKIDENRRGFVRRLLGVSFAAPLIASFSLGALSATTANAQAVSNTTDAFCREDLEAAMSFEGPAGTGRCIVDDTPPTN